jgi:hypothetical protein
MQFVNRRYKVAEKVDKEGHPYEETRWSFVGGTHDLRDTIAEDIVEVLNYNVGMNAQSRSGMDDTDERSDFIEQLTHHLRCIFIRLKQTIETDQANPIRTALVLEAVFMKVLHALTSGRIDADSVTLHSLRENVAGYRKDLGKIAVNLLDFLPQAGKEGGRRVFLIMETGQPSVIELAVRNRNTSFLADNLVSTWIKEMYAGQLFEVLASGDLEPAERLPSDKTPEARLYKDFKESAFNPFRVPTFNPLNAFIDEPLERFSSRVLDGVSDNVVSADAATAEPAEKEASTNVLISGSTGYTAIERVQAYFIDSEWYYSEAYSPARYLKSPMYVRCYAYHPRDTSSPPDALLAWFTATVPGAIWNFSPWHFIPCFTSSRCSIIDPKRRPGWLYSQSSR